jgi:aerobic C4-dicarboxylate transport protein
MQTAAVHAHHPKPFYAQLYVQVLFAIVLGGLFGWLLPDAGHANKAIQCVLGPYTPYATSDWIKALGDGFVKLIKMVITPIIFFTVVSGIAHVRDAKSVGRIGVKALLYFEVVSTVALIIGLIMGNILFPLINDGVQALFSMFNGDVAGPVVFGTPDAKAVAQFTDPSKQIHSVDFLLNIIPDSVVGAFSKGDVLQVLLFAILFGFALMAMGDRATSIRRFIDDAAQAVFGVISIIMKAAPIGAFGAMAYTIGKYGPSVFGNLFSLVATFYLTSALFIFVVLGIVAAVVGFSIFKYIAYIKDELLVVLSTSSSESALPQLMEKLERLGCSKPVVGLVVPTGYSFNLDGTNIYMTLATVFIAYAMGVHLDLEQQLVILGVAMLTSKGASGITGAGFITLGATLAVVDPRLVPGMAIVLGIDKFMSECRALTNISGNGIACIVVSWWEGELDRDKLNAGLNRTVDLTDIQSATRVS